MTTHWQRLETSMIWIISLNIPFHCKCQCSKGKIVLSSKISSLIIQDFLLSYIPELYKWLNYSPNYSWPIFYGIRNGYTHYWIQINIFRVFLSQIYKRANVKWDSIVKIIQITTKGLYCNYFAIMYALIIYVIV